MPEIIFGKYAGDTRGNRLDRYRVRRLKDPSRDDCRLYLCCSGEIAQQVIWLLQRAGLAPRKMELKPDDRGTYTHRIAISGALPPETEAALELLREVVTMGRRGVLDVALAVDFYMDADADPDIDPEEWPRTAAGELNYQAKYCQNDSAFADLVDGLAGLIRAHPLYATADCVVSVPGHKPSEPSFGVALAQAVAREVSKPFIETSCSLEERPQAKEGSSTTAELQKASDLPDSVRGKVVLIIDDVYKTGSSMSAVAAVAKRRGARRAIGLAGVRTMRKS